MCGFAWVCIRYEFVGLGRGREPSQYFSRCSKNEVFLSLTGKTSTPSSSWRRQSPGTTISGRQRLHAAEMNNEGTGQPTAAGGAHPAIYSLSRAARQPSGAAQGTPRAMPQLGARRPRSGSGDAQSPNSRSGAAQRIDAGANALGDVDMQRGLGLAPAQVHAPEHQWQQTMGGYWSPMQQALQQPLGQYSHHTSERHPSPGYTYPDYSNTSQVCRSSAHIAACSPCMAHAWLAFRLAPALIA